MIVSWLIQLLYILIYISVQISQVQTSSHTQLQPGMSFSQGHPGTSMYPSGLGQYEAQHKGTGCLGPACSAPGARGTYLFPCFRKKFESLLNYVFKSIFLQAQTSNSSFKRNNVKARERSFNKIIFLGSTTGTATV